MVEKEVYKGQTYIQLNTIVNEEVNSYQLTLSYLGESKGGPVFPIVWKVCITKME